MTKNFKVIDYYDYFDMRDNLILNSKRVSNTYMVGNKNEGIQHYHIIEFQNPSLNIGVCTAILQFRDDDVVQDKGGNIIIGFDKYLVWLRKDENFTPLVLDTSSFCILVCFFEFLELSYSEVIAIFEIGALKINFLGNVVWKIDFHDIVVDYKIEDNCVLSIKCMDGNSRRYDIETGKQIQ